MGAEVAARAAERLLDCWRPRLLVSLGFGGALFPGLAPGDAVLGESCWRYDPNGGGLEEVKAPTPPVSPGELARGLQNAGLPAFSGSIVSTPGIIHKGRQGLTLRGLLRPVLDLETGAAAAAAQAAAVPFLALRVITDGPGEEIPEFLRRDWEPGFGPGLQKALAWLARDPRRLQDLLHLWRRARLAARRLSRALQVILPLL
jgi:adenosylhomocysteine nucleosidase